MGRGAVRLGRDRSADGGGLRSRARGSRAAAIILAGMGTYPYGSVGPSNTMDCVKRRLRIGMLGTRGVPASYSGFETCAEELGARLAQRGHEVTVYCRVPHVSYPGAAYRGMRLVKLPTIRSKHLDTITHTLLSSIHALGAR